MPRIQNRSKNFVLTLWPDNPKFEKLISTLKDISRYGYLGKEICPSTGKLHWQGFCCFKYQQALSTMRTLCKGHSVEPMGAKVEHNSLYAVKELDDSIEWGIKPHQGIRNDLDESRLLAISGGMRQVTSFCNFQEMKVAEKYLTYNEPPRDWKPIVKWYWGKPGAGKTKMAFDETNSTQRYVKSTGTKWWDGYDAHEQVILDDFRPEWFSNDFQYLLGLLDRYEMRVEVKGGMRQFKPKIIIITSTSKPLEFFPTYGKENPLQLTRRIDTIEEIGYAL